jgi:hypothetical protein
MPRSTVLHHKKRLSHCKQKIAREQISQRRKQVEWKKKNKEEEQIKKNEEEEEWRTDRQTPDRKIPTVKIPRED